MKTALVIASWAGLRRNGQQKQWEYLRAWQEALGRYSNSIDTVIIADNICHDEDDGYRAELFAMPEPNVILRRENVGGSYCAWWDVYQLFRDRFDWYFVFEDDYLPVQDDWDQKILAYDREGVGYIGGLIGHASYERHMGAANGAVKSSALAKCEFPEYGTAPNYADAYQIGFSQMFIRAGYEIVEYAGEYAVPFWNGTIVLLGNQDVAPLIVPFQYYRTRM